jgi:hypothetical protein
VVVVLSNGGFQIPIIPLLEVVGSAVIGPPLHTGFTVEKVGTILGLTVMVKVVNVAHCPPFGVKV